MTSTGKGVEKRDLACVAGGREIVKLLRKTVWQLLKWINIELP